MKIALIGCGNMGSSMAKPLAREHSLTLYDKFPQKITLHKEFPNVKIAKDLPEALAGAEVVLLAIKPYDLKHIAPALKEHLKPHQIIVSVLTGYSTERLKNTLKVDNPIVHMMPNLAVEYGQGIMGIANSLHLSEEVKKTLSLLFSSMGLLLWIPEEAMNGFTALAGSGIAFVLVFIEAMIDAGISLGFSSSDAKKIVMQTIAGALSFLQHSGKHPGELRWQVSSPAGTTIAGHIALEAANVRSGIIKTFLACYERTRELEANL